MVGGLGGIMIFELVAPAARLIFFPLCVSFVANGTCTA